LLVFQTQGVRCAWSSLLFGVEDDESDEEDELVETEEGNVDEECVDEDEDGPGGLENLDAFGFFAGSSTVTAARSCVPGTGWFFVIFLAS
jgi:hypothetical protein